MDNKLNEDVFILKKIRDFLKLTQKEFSAKIGMTSKYISRLECEKNVTPNVKDKILNFTNDIADDIFDEYRKELETYMKNRPDQKNQRSKFIFSDDFKDNIKDMFFDIFEKEKKQLEQEKDEFQQEKENFKQLIKDTKNNSKLTGEQIIRMKALTNELSLKSSAMDMIWRFNDLSVKTFGELELYLELLDPKEVKKMERGLNKISKTLIEQANKIDSYLDEYEDIKDLIDIKS